MKRGKGWKEKRWIGEERCVSTVRECKRFIDKDSKGSLIIFTYSRARSQCHVVVDWWCGQWCAGGVIIKLLTCELRSHLTGATASAYSADRHVPLHSVSSFVGPKARPRDGEKPRTVLQYIIAVWPP